MNHERFLRSIRCNQDEAAAWLLVLHLREEGYAVTVPIDNSFGHYHIYIVFKPDEVRETCGLNGCWYRRNHDANTNFESHSDEPDHYVFRSIA